MLIKSKKLISMVRTSTYQNPNEMEVPGSYGVRIQIFDDPSITAVLTKYGKCMVYGGDTPRNWTQIVDVVMEMTQFQLSQSYLVRNMVYRAELSSEVDLNKSLRQFVSAEYEPEQFPGLIIRAQEHEKLTLIVFKSGKMMITGVRGNEAEIENQMLEAGDLVRELIPL
jgi:TATA-box binding protein (TBP) (component of TFIID and TFIIIB)